MSETTKKQSLKDSKLESSEGKDFADEAAPNAAKPAVKIEKEENKNSSTPKKKVRVLNRTNRVIEFDFGRDKEVRIAPKETAEMDAKYLEHPDVVRERPNIVIYR